MMEAKKADIHSKKKQIGSSETKNMKVIQLFLVGADYFLM